MRVIYLVRTFQLVMAVNALYLLYSVRNFCEKTVHPMNYCPSLQGIPMAMPEQIQEHLRIKHQRAANNRLSKTYMTTFNATSVAHQSASGSTVHPSTGEPAKSRKRREEERKELPGNGVSEARYPNKQPNDAAPAEVAAHAADAAPAAKASTAAPVEVKKEEVKQATTKAKKEEVKQPTTEAKVVEKVPESTTPEMKKEEDKKVTEAAKAVEKVPDRVQTTPEAKKEEVTITTTVEATTTTSAAISTAAAAAKKEEKKGEKVDIPAVKSSDEPHVEEKKKEEKPTVERDVERREVEHHSVKKDLKAHILDDENQGETTTAAAAATTTDQPPHLPPMQQDFVLEHSDAFLEEIRCIEVTSDDYFGREISPYSQHLKGLLFAGPVLVVICIYLVCTVLRARLCHEPPSEFIDFLGSVFQCAMWSVVALTMFFIANHWATNWTEVSNSTFRPEFPCKWWTLIILSSFMMVVASVESWFHKRLYYNIVFQRGYGSYDVYEPVDPSNTQPEGSFTSTDA